MLAKHKSATPRAGDSTAVLDNLTALRHHFTQEELIALVHDFARELATAQQQRLLSQATRGPRPLDAEAMGPADADELLAEIATLRGDIADDVYVEYGAGYDPSTAAIAALATTVGLTRWISCTRRRPASIAREGSKLQATLTLHSSP